MFFFGIVITSCKQEDLPIKVESVTLDITSLTMSVGETRSLTATISPSDAENQKVLWSTSNANVVTVKDGVISAAAAGEAMVVVKTEDGGKTAECAVVVKGTNEEDENEEEGEGEWPVTLEISAVTATTVQFDMTLDINAISEYQEAGLIFSSVADVDVAAEEVTIFQLNRESYSKVFGNLTYNTKYYYTTYLKKDGFYLYGEKEEFTTSNVLLGISIASSTATTAQISGTVDGLSDSDKSLIEVGLFYSSESGQVENGQGTKLVATEISSENAFSFDLSDLMFGTKYYYCSYVKQGEEYVYDEVKEFVAGSVSVNLSAGSITATTAQITGVVEGLSESDKSLIEVGLLYSSESGQVENGQGTKLTASEIPSDNVVSFDLSELYYGTKYYYCSYVKQGEGYVYGEVKGFITKSPDPPTGYTNLSSAGTANCYIISQSGSYCLLVAKGNQSSDLLHLTKSASVLWESFGTSTAPSVGDLIKSVFCKGGYIAFQTADTFKEGNAVIAAKDADGNVLWSWHIWFTDQPQGQEYYNNAGTMMDRNLGATSATPGDVGALGLLYQWGRKDPFLGSSSIGGSNLSISTLAKSTITWPSAVETSYSVGTVDYVTSNPTTFVKPSSWPYDWHYSSRDNNLWTTSDKSKSVYDPCPSGWRVPDGGTNGIWLNAGFDDTTYDSTNKGISFSISSPSKTWYPASGYRHYYYGDLGGVGRSGSYWSASPYGYGACYLVFRNDGYVNPSSSDDARAGGQSVRCLQE